MVLPLIPPAVLAAAPAIGAVGAAIGAKVIPLMSRAAPVVAKAGGGGGGAAAAAAAATKTASAATKATKTRGTAAALKTRKSPKTKKTPKTPNKNPKSSAKDKAKGLGKEVVKEAAAEALWSVLDPFGSRGGGDGTGAGEYDDPTNPRDDAGGGAKGEVEQGKLSGPQFTGLGALGVMTGQSGLDQEGKERTLFHQGVAGVDNVDAPYANMEETRNTPKKVFTWDKPEGVLPHGKETKGSVLNYVADDGKS